MFQMFLGGLCKSPYAYPVFGVNSDSGEPAKEPLIPSQHIKIPKRAKSLNDIPRIRTHASVRNELVKNVFTSIANAFCSLFNRGTNYTP